MGFLFYGTTGFAVEIDDRPLAHLKVAILSLLRADKCVALSFVYPAHSGSGRETMWISPTTELRFRFNGSRPMAINEQWVRMLIETANTGTGLHLVDEPAPLSAVRV
ncbi:ATP-dependent DNA ligase [Herbiconiux sp. CPCC 205763]|uniref:ATP-dependent DNA ligase n=1 Tax=Herbiconiux aconitum TaxID=2970913 RepID=A0ABT2GRB1_9MICO|nr:ATP-dependent DNA ligase [Herbiconiux aconitum]MCS5718760.1 ATP-dependent DNA ligase [Herbiconiux aconitum]